jgi:hypothetical protein
MPPKKKPAASPAPIAESDNAPAQQNEEQNEQQDEQSDDESSTNSEISDVTGDAPPAPATKRIRFLVPIASPDWSAMPGEIQEHPATLADAFADGVRAEHVDVE